MGAAMPMMGMGGGVPMMGVGMMGSGMPLMGGVNPLMMNPLLAAQAQATLQRLKGGASLGTPTPVAAPPQRESPRIDPDVQELCDHFDIHDEKVAIRLSDCMANRQDTFNADMQKLWEVLECARSPSGLLMVKIR